MTLQSLSENRKHTIREKVTQLQSQFRSGLTRDIDTRKQLLAALKKELKQQEGAVIEAMQRDLGKSATESLVTEVTQVYSEIDFCLSHIEEWAAERRVPSPVLVQPGRSRILPEPKGVVLIFAPWNYPLYLSLMPLIGAISAGNCALVKPAHESAHTARVIKGIIEEAFDGEGVAVVTGPGAEVGPYLMQNFRFDHIFFTGSPAVGRQVMKQAAEQLTPVTLELGGQSPGIVERRASLKVAARRLVHGKFVNAGQTCIAPNHLMVQAEVRDQLIEEIVGAIREFYGTDPGQSKDFGRLISKDKWDELDQWMQGIDPIFGGDRKREDRYWGPTLIEAPSLDHPLMKNEIFGPIWPILSWEEEKELFDLLDQFRNPLSCYLFVGHRPLRDRILREYSFGGGCVNNTLLQMGNPHLPFGGIGSSGMGAYHGKTGFDTFSHLKSILVSSSWPDPSFRYPPYTDWTRRIIDWMS